MRSPQAELYPDARQYSELQPLLSASGWYLGTVYADGSTGTRDTDYFESMTEALLFLTRLEGGDPGALSKLRKIP